MGTAPTDRHQPELPDAVQLVDNALAVLQRLGLPDREALALIGNAARSVLHHLGGAEFQDQAWLIGVVLDAEMRAAGSPVT